MTLSSATFGYFIISLIFSRPVQAKQPRPLHDNRHTTTIASDKAASNDPTVAKESSGRTSSSPNQPKETSSVPSNTTRSQNVPSPAEDASHQTTTTTRPVERELIGREKVTESEETGGTSTTCSSVVSSTAEDGSDSGTVTH
ncbi:hypothetical protein QFC19_002807 [Naganishia cerealis]|uniref:Uncharacterized protein n=1 Tax=Naganishia cerealis TaxID=610337 RepID=A0ACC2W964_9TREE|nr:hypothetical protein QFC19_002807 [Naganishia cerealis]